MLAAPETWAAVLPSLSWCRAALALSLLGLTAPAWAQPAGDSVIASPKIGSADTLRAAAPETPTTPLVEPPPGATPLMVLAQIEQGWRAGAPEVVVGCLASEGIQIECEHACPPGRYARPQAEFLIRDLLHYGDTKDFRLTRFEWKGENAKGQAVWVHTMGTVEKTVQVDFELIEKAGNWRVVKLASH